MMAPKLRITITLPPEIVSEIDQRIDHIFLKNRSHVIECLLAQAIGFAPVKQAVILAGGENADQKIAQAPKIVQALKKTMVKNILIITGAIGLDSRDKLKLASLASLNCQILSSREGSAGALREHQKLITPTGPFLVFNIKKLPKDFELSAFIKFHYKTGKIATLYKLNSENNEIYLFEPEIFRYIPKRGFALLETDVLPELFKNNLAVTYLRERKR